MNKLIIGIIIIGVVVVIWVDLPRNQSNVEVTPAPKAEGYVFPVREGNCWSQIIGVGTKDSVLVFC